MTKKVLSLPLIALIVIAPLTLVAWSMDENEEEVTLDQVPADVRATILKESAGGRITEIERETKNGQVTYEAEFLLNGQEIEIKIGADGTLLGREVEDEDDDEDDLTIAQVPEPARSALLQAAGGAKIVRAEREREQGVLIYEAKWVKNGKKHEAAVTAAGALIETEEIISADEAPAVVRSVIAKRFGAGAKVVVEKKMIVVYEVEARINGQEKEFLVFPTGRVVEDPDDEDDDHDDHDDHDHDHDHDHDDHDDDDHD